MKKNILNNLFIVSLFLSATVSAQPGVLIGPIDGGSNINRAPKAACSSSIDLMGGGNPREVTFDASNSYDPDGNIIEYKWTLGDGSVRYGQTLTHQFYPPSNQQSWIYYPSLKVTDDDGRSSTSLNCGGVPTGIDVLWHDDEIDEVSSLYYWLVGATVWHVGDGTLYSQWSY